MKTRSAHAGGCPCSGVPVSSVQKWGQGSNQAGGAAICLESASADPECHPG